MVTTSWMSRWDGSGSEGLATLARFGLASILAIGSVACGGEGDAGHGPYPARYPAAPRVENFGGPVLEAPVFVPVFFANDDSEVVAQLEDFVIRVGASPYWAATTSEYGVGPATSAAAIDLAEDAPATIEQAEVEAWLADKLEGASPVFPTPDANTLFVLHYSPGTTITAGGPAGPFGPVETCKSLAGYHRHISLSTGQEVAYAVIPRCDSSFGLTGIDALTGVESHELVEAATDPYLETHPAYLEVDPAHVFWSRVTGGEVADLCTQLPGAFARFPDLPFTVQRSWSNEAAAAGHDPCVPQPEGEVYFNAAPELSDVIPVRYDGPASEYGPLVNVRGVKVPAGQSKTIPIDLFSDGDTGGPWLVRVDGTELSVFFTLHLDRNIGYNGDQLLLTIAADAAAPADSTEGRGFVVTSTLGARTSTWLGIVGH